MVKLPGPHATAKPPRLLSFMKSATASSSDASSSGSATRPLGDFTTDPRVLVVAAIAVVVATAGVAAGALLLKLIRLATNIAYFGQFSLANLKLGHSPLGLWAALVPVGGALIVGLIDRYGSE